MMRSIFKLLFFLLFCYSKLCAAPFEFQHFSTSDGLSSSKVTCITQDERGYMWFGTYDGLNRFDGSEFVVYRNDNQNPHSISSNAIEGFFEDSKGRLWISTHKGLNLYDYRTDKFFLFPDENGRSLTRARMVELADSSLFILGRSTVFKIDFVDSICVGLSSPEFLRIRGDAIAGTNLIKRGDTLWFSSSTKGLIKMDAQLQSSQAFSAKTHAARGLQTNSILDLAVDERENFWLASRHGLYYFDRSLQNFNLYKHDPMDPDGVSETACSKVLMDDDGNLWVTMTNGGVNLKKKNASGFQHIKHEPTNAKSLISDAVQSVYVDRQKNVWIATLQGVSFLRQARSGFKSFRNDPNTLNSLSNNNVTSFAEDKKGNLWIGTDGGGLNYFDRLTHTFQHFRMDSHGLPSDAILSCLYDQDEQLWVGAYLGGLALLRSDRSFQHVMHSSDGFIPIQTNDVRALLEDRSGDLWVATHGDGLYYLHEKNWQQATRYENRMDDPTSLPQDFCLTLFEDREGVMWVGMFNGLGRLDRETNTFQSYNENVDDPNSLRGSWVYSIYEDSKNRLWIGTANGLNLMERQSGTFKSYTSHDGLSGDIINDILEDTDGRLWISTNNGIARFDTDKNAFTIYTQTDGLQGNEFNHGAALKLSTGEMVFGGTNGFTIFHPDSVSEHTNSPPVQLHKIQYLNKAENEKLGIPVEQTISGASKIVLDYGRAKTFRIFYGAIEFDVPDKVRYYYRLDGYQNQWVDNGENRSVTFMNLPAGNYTLHIAATISPGEPDLSTKLVLKIRPPWWLSPFASVAYAVLLISFILIYHFISTRFMKLKMDLETQKVEKEKAKELENAKSQFFTNISHEFRTPLTLLLVPLRELLKGTHTYDAKSLMGQFRLMRRSADRLLRLVNQVIDMNKIEAGRLELYKKETELVSFIQKIVDTFQPLAVDKNVTLDLKSTVSRLYASVDSEKIDIVIFNLLSNAFKFSPEGSEITVSLRLEHEMIFIDVQDAGPGIPAEHIRFIFNRFYHQDYTSQQNHHGAGIGLALSKELVEMHGGRISVKNVEPGALFTIALPHAHDGSPISYAIERQREEPHEVSVIEPEKNDELSTLLIVEDDLDLRDYLKTQLQPDYNILTALHGKAGLSLAREQLPDIVLTDIMMSEMNGIEMCQKLKTDQLTSHIPIILLTARKSETQQLEGLDTGADDYLTKPFNLDLLKARIKNLLDNRRQLREQFSKQIRLSPKDIVIHDLDEKFISRAIDVIEQNMDNQDFSVAQMGHHLGLSRAQLFRKLKALTDETPMEFIQSIRLKRAAALLEKSSKTITEITYDVGFRYPNHFAKAFHKRFDVSPTAYRKKMNDHDGDT